MEENNACAPTRVFPRIEDCCDARDGLGKEYGRGGAHVSGQSQTARGLERRVASERRAGVSWQGCSPAAETGCRADCRAGTQDRTADDGARFFKKALRRFREQPLPAAANGNAGSMSKSGKRPKRRQR